jgi:hypothetical protein
VIGKLNLFCVPLEILPANCVFGLAGNISKSYYIIQIYTDYCSFTVCVRLLLQIDLILEDDYAQQIWNVVLGNIQVKVRKY